MGTGESKTCKPTLDHFPTGSKLIPRLIKAWAKSRRLVFNVLARMTTGLGTSFASKNSIAYFFYYIFFFFVF